MSEASVHRHGLVVPAHMKMHPSTLQKRAWLMEERVVYLSLSWSFKRGAVPPKAIPLVGAIIVKDVSQGK